MSAGTDERFQVVAPLGSGGFGAVYEAIDLRSGQRVALKELDDASAGGIARFKQEFRALADLHHENLVSLKELIGEGEHWYILMELVPGSDFITFVRGAAANDNQTYDEARLRAALRGMAEGLIALHRFGVLHRDLKPTNVRVTPEGRAVLLDFGLVAPVDVKEQSTHAGLFGTVPYMAPEQATRPNVGPPADWYAFGVCLFEALTGRRPFEGETAFEILSSKQTLTAPRASSLVASVPADLDELCARLLERAPEVRAGPRDVLAVLGSSSDEGGDAGQSHAVLPVTFAGREPELLQLQRAFERTRDGAFKLVLVEGESGVGKTEVVAEFVKRARAVDPALTVLTGRCYENEQVSYKAFDGCIDELAKLLRRLPEGESAALLPPRAFLLGQLFPVLRTIGAIARAPRGESSAEPTARRLEAFVALTALLSKLAEDRPVVLVIDDLQWADAESFRLLLAIAENLAPPALMIVATIRPPEELEAAVTTGLEAFRRKQRIDVVQILGLPAYEAEALVRTLLGPDAPAKYCQTIAAESEGHPLFLTELVQFARSYDLAARGALTLEAALRARIDRLGGHARELLELAALAGRPHGPHIFARALGRETVEEQARTLLAAKLLRLRKGQELGCYHDRIRRAAVSLIATSRLGTLHRRLAEALSSDPLSDTFEQAHHWDLAGEKEAAVAAYEAAACTARDALAFARVSELCARALRLLGNERDERSQRLLVMQAHAFACAGRNAESALLYDRASQGATGQAQSRLRARHAQQLIMSGSVDRGLAAMRSVLSELGIRFPQGTLGLMLQIIWHRAWLKLRGDRFEARPSRAGEEQLVLTSEVLMMFMGVIAPLNPLGTMLGVLRSLRLAVKLPTPAFVLQLYAGVGWLRALGGSPSAARLMFDKCHTLSPSVDSMTSQANAAFVEGSASMLSWDYKGAAPHLERAQLLLQTRCPDEPASLRNVRYHLGLTWFSIGQHGRIAHEVSHWVAEARERNDTMTVSLLMGMGCGFLRHLMRDEPDAALLELEALMATWPKEPYTFIQHGLTVGYVNTLLYKGGPGAHEWLEAQAAAHARPMLLRSSMGRLLLSWYRGQAALHACQNAVPKQRAVLTSRIRKNAVFLARSRAPITRVYGHLLFAQLHMLDERTADALVEARAASALFPDWTSSQSVMLAHFLVGLLESGTTTDSRCDSVLSFLRDQGWRDPWAFLRAMLPALAPFAPQVALPASQGTLLLGRYEVVRTLGGGGFGSVVEAREVKTGRSFAVKTLVSDHPRSLERFKREFRALSNLHHANLVRLDGLVQHEGVWYIVMELLVGEPLLQHVRPNDKPDHRRICAALEGLIDGLLALHAEGFAHRDVTPDNVRVTDDGRAVLLDFGLIGRLGDETDEGLVGSVEYAAPEQLEGAAPHTAADVYGLGVCLYQSLTGRLPFVGETPALRLQQKVLGVVPSPREQDHGRLGPLAVHMMALDAAARPSLHEVRTRLHAPEPSLQVTFPLAHSESIDHFAGREHELTRLDDAYERNCDEGLVVVLVEGESGLGKSALMAEFGRRIRARVPNALILRSHCYESEQVALKAFDGAVDELARTLRSLPSPTCEALLPRSAMLLGQLFPVLKSVPAIAHAPKKGVPADPAVRQRASVACFIELLERLAGHFELLFFIDDLQWADVESFRLLQTLLARREALPIFIVCSVRPMVEIGKSVSVELLRLRASAGVEILPLAGLEDVAATRLLTDLNGEPLSAERSACLLQEAKGHPLFLRELVEQERVGEAAPGALTLDRALKSRIQHFDSDARALLSLVALAGKPYGSHVFARALGAQELSRVALAALLGRGFLRRNGTDALAVYHDRIARAALDLLLPEQLCSLARDLATSLDGESGADSGERARLWDVAGDPDRAGRAYELAGDAALAALHFLGAVQHYTRALDLHGEEHDDRFRGLLTRRAEALARAGRSAEAAQAYSTAAAGAEGEARVRLRIAAAEQAIQSAQSEQGLAAALELLRELGIAIPSSPRAALAQTAWDRACVALRGYAITAPRQPISARTRMQLDAAWSLATPLSWLDPIASAALTTRHLRLALASGEPSHTTRALATEAFSRAVQRSSDGKSDGLIARARELAVQLGDPALESEVTYREGLVATYRWNLTQANERLERALQNVTERCPDQPWLTTNIRLALGAVRFNRGEHRRLAQESETWLAEASDRGDAFALTNLNGLGYGFVRHLMADNPDAVEAELALYRSSWPAEPFSFVHFGDLIATTYRLLYQGGERALSWHEREQPRLSRAFLLRRGMSRGVVLNLQATAYLSAWCTGTRAGDPALLERARSLTSALARLDTMFASHMAPFLAAQLDVLDGERDRALRTVRKAREAALACGFHLHADRAHYLQAALEGSAHRHEIHQQLMTSYAAQGWKHPRRGLSMTCPVIDVVDTGGPEGLPRRLTEVDRR